jgi:hypothetical protein
MNRLLKIALCAAAVSALASPAFAQAEATQSTTGTTRIIQPITLTKDSDLAFGSVVKPPTGSNNVIIDEATGARTTDGGGDVALAPSTTSRAAFTVGGEGGQTFSITNPGTFDMTRVGGSETLTVTLVATAATGLISGTLGSAGTATFGVGGSFPVATGTVSGNYTGSFDVTVAYN